MRGSCEVGARCMLDQWLASSRSMSDAQQTANNSFRRQNKLPPQIMPHRLGYNDTLLEDGLACPADIAALFVTTLKEEGLLQGSGDAAPDEKQKGHPCGRGP